MNLKTIAQKAGVSTATVSNVINGNFHKVSRETVEKVQQVIRENHYKPNAAARSLASRKSRIVGVVLPNIHDGDSFFVNPHDAHLLAQLEQHIRSRGYYMMPRCVTHARDSVPLFSTWNVDGIICFGTSAEEIRGLLEAADVPVVFIDGYDAQQDLVSVGIDDYKGGSLAARYLLGKGHREIAIAGPPTAVSGVVEARYAGFRDACAEKGVTVPEESVFCTNTQYQSGVTAGQQIAMSGKHYSAVWCISDIVAFGVMEGLRLCGLNVPGDISVVGFDNLPECDYSYPKLTTISQNVDGKASRAIQLLLERIEGGNTAGHREHSDVQIVERNSVRDLNL